MELTKQTTTEEMQSANSLAWDYRDEAIIVLQAERDHYREALMDIGITAQMASNASPEQFPEWTYNRVREALNPTRDRVQHLSSAIEAECLRQGEDNLDFDAIARVAIVRQHEAEQRITFRPDPTNDGKPYCSGINTLRVSVKDPSGYSAEKIAAIILAFCRGYEDYVSPAYTRHMDLARKIAEADIRCEYPELAICTSCGKTTKYGAACDCFIPGQQREISVNEDQLQGCIVDEMIGVPGNRVAMATRIINRIRPYIRTTEPAPATESSVDAETLSDVVDEYLHWRKVNPHIKGGENYLKRLRAATRKPVIVDLETCAKAAWDSTPHHCEVTWDEAKKLSFMEPNYKECLRQTKAALDTAGVKYGE